MADLPGQLFAQAHTISWPSRGNGIWYVDGDWGMSRYMDIDTNSIFYCLCVFLNGSASLLFVQFCTCFPSTMMSFYRVFLSHVLFCFALLCFWFCFWCDTRFATIFWHFVLALNCNIEKIYILSKICQFVKRNIVILTSLLYLNPNIISSKSNPSYI